MGISIGQGWNTKKKLALLGCLMVWCAFLQAQNNCTCTNCPLTLPDGFDGDATLQISGATNSVLGQNGQGICGVQLDFRHEWVEDLRITLTSPSGQTIQLLGEAGFTGGPTFFTNWDVTFLPCGITPAPDPPFLDQWQNNNAWGQFGNYTGTYHPFLGCLESFNSGSVNGTWTLHIEDLQTSHAGILDSWSLIFCDPAGINCFSCAANAGELTQTDINACPGNNALAFTPAPTYPAGAAQPPSPTYSYTYVVTDNLGIITQITTAPNLTTNPTGSYAVCGLSYLTTQVSALPVPNGSITLNQLNVDLQSTSPSFCGDLTSNCVGVNVLQPIPDSTLSTSICAGQSVSFFGTNYTASGTYPNTITQGNCTFQATLQLNVVSPSRDTIRETICSGNCSTEPGFASACATGSYFDTLLTVSGCDSLYRVLELIVLDIQNIQVIPANPIVSCGSPATAMVQLTGSTPNSDINYSWFLTGNPVPIQTGNAFSTLTPGNYQVQICETLNGQTCCTAINFMVGFSPGIPTAPIDITVPQPVCIGDTFLVSTTQIAGSSQYNWQFPPGFTALPSSADTLLRLIATTSGNYNICVSASNNCGTSQAYCEPIAIGATVVQPTLIGPTVACANSPTIYQVTNLPAGISAFWTVTNDLATNAFPVPDSIRVVWPGGLTNGQVCVSFVSDCADTLTTCAGISAPTLPPQNQLFANVDTTCFGGSIELSVPTASAGVNYGWSYSPQLGLIAGGQNTVQLLANTLGTFEVCAWYFTACESSDTTCRNITFLNNQPPDAGPDITSFCDTLVQLQGGGITARWSIASGPPGANIADVMMPNSQFSGPPGTYQLVRTSGGGACVRTDTTVITLGSSVQITNAQPACLPGDTSYQVAVTWTGGTPPYQLTGSAPLMIQSGISQTFQSGSPSIIILQDANGCADTTSATISCGCNNVAGSFSQPLIAGCVGSDLVLPYNNDALPAQGQLVHFAVGATNNYTDPILYQSLSNVIPYNTSLFLPNTTYFAWVVVAEKGINGEIDWNDPCLQVSQVVSLQWITLPTVNLSGDMATCFGYPDTLSFVLTPTSQIYPLQVILSHGLGTVDTVLFNNPTPITILDTDPANGWYFISEVLITQDPGCAAIEFDSIFVTPVQYNEAIIADSVQVCNTSGSTVNFSTLVFTGHVNGFWSGPVGTGSFTNRDFSGVAPGLYPFVYNHPINLPCPPGNDTCWVRVSDCSCPPITLQAPIGALCNLGIGTIDLMQFVVSAPPGNFTLAAFPPSANVQVVANAINLENAPGGDYVFLYTLTNPQPGCPTSAPITLTLASGGANAGSPIADTIRLCQDTSIIFFSSNLQGASPGGRWEYQGSWVSPLINVIELSGACQTQLLPIGDHPFAYILAGVPPCAGDTSVFVLRIVAPPTANAGSDQLIDCTMPLVLLDAGSSVPSVVITYIWSSAQTTMTLGTQVTQEVFAEGSYYLTVQDLTTGCMDTDTVNVTTDGSLPIGQISVSPAGCGTQQNGVVRLDQIIGGTPPYQVLFDGVVQTTTSFPGLAPGIHTIEVIDAQGCMWSNQQVVVPQGGVVAVSLGNDIEINLGDSAIITAQISSAVGIDTLVWSELGVDNQPLALIQVYKPLAPLRVRLTITDSLGCTGYDDVLINVLRSDGPVVPNVFAPGSINNHAVTVLGSTDIERIVSWSIFDRWGNMVYRASDFAPGDYSIAWDGTFRDRFVQPGVFVSSVQYRTRDGKEYWSKSDITVVREE